MPIRWDLVDNVNELESFVLERISICDKCDKCEESVGICTASECKCFAISLAHDKNFNCPLNKW